MIGYLAIPADKQSMVKGDLEKEISLALSNGYRTFLTRYAEQPDMLFARCVMEYRQQYPDLFLESILPTPAHAERFSREEWELLSRCDGLKVLCESCREDWALNITRYLIDQSSRVIVVYDGGADHDLLFAMDYAPTIDRAFRIIKIYYKTDRKTMTAVIALMLFFYAKNRWITI